ncbi:MAG: hypothetical protein ABIH82_01830 [Candidatus Woesearchaeota archaeon]
MNKKASVMQVLVMMIVVVVTSGVILLLINTGIISVKAQSNEPILNTEFIPLGREGYLTIKEFKFCEFVDENYNCVNEKTQFNFGEEVHFLFIVETSTYNGDVMLVENYQLIDSAGTVLLDVDEKNNYHFDVKSNEKKELITFKDYFIVNAGSLPGVYKLNLIMENPLLNKRTTLSKSFMEKDLEGSQSGD